MAEQSGSFHCTEQRAILTTDLIFFDTTHGRKDVISVVHYDPGNFMNAPASPVDGVLWQNGCADNSCRVTVRAPADQPITTPGTTQHLTINFTALARQLATKYLGGLTIDSGTGIYAVQFVNSTRGADLQTRVSNVNVMVQ